MQNPKVFYNQQTVKYNHEVKVLFRALSLFSILRLVVFATTAIGIYFTFSNWRVALGIALVGIAGFLVLLVKHTNTKHRRNLYKRLIAINETELKVAAGKFHDLPDGIAFQNPEHYFSLDIDLFGRGSFFQYINRTTIKAGTQALVNYLLANDTEDIPHRQDAIRELANLAQWRQHYSAVAQGIDTEYNAQSIVAWLKNYTPVLTKYVYMFSLGFSGISIGLLIASFTGYIPLSSVGYWLLLGLIITGRYLKQINTIAQHTSKAKDTFKQYALLLKAIESQTFTSDLLIEKQQRIQSGALSASQIFMRFSKAIDALDNRNNLISAIFGNGYLLWDIRQAYHIEQWIINYTQKVDDWFDVVTFFDAFNTLGTFAFNHQTFVYPKISNEGETLLSAKQLGHPLLNSKLRVDSDVDILQEQFFIITGANMAGKSTFLRTIALHIVMANVGLPVCAKASHYTPIKLITSMRTTDSLTDNSSYFYSELTRLKFIVDTIENQTNYFIILDEILKGTNSTDKAIGSRQFVEKLIKLKATGIIATHDLSLTEVAQELKAVKNYYFDAQIINDELFFDYALKRGICQNMNASFLLKKMEIV